MGPRRVDRLSDAELLALVGTGPEGGEAFAVFYRRHEARVLAYLRRRVPRPDLAADLAAETFAAALAAAPRFKSGPSGEGAAGWLLVIAHNQLVTSVRKGRVADATRRRLGLAEPLWLSDAALERVDELASIPERLDAELADLPADQRAAVLARVVDQRPYEQIAADMSCSELVVRQRVSRGLARLRQRLSLEAS